MLHPFHTESKTREILYCVGCFPHQLCTILCLECNGLGQRSWHLEMISQNDCRLSTDYIVLHQVLGSH